MRLFRSVNASIDVLRRRETLSLPARAAAVFEGEGLHSSSDLSVSNTSVMPSLHSSSPPSSASDRSDGGHGSGGGLSASAAVVLTSGNDVMSETRLVELSNVLEDRRLARQKKMFDDMIVFEGGAIADHESLGLHMIMRDFVHFGLYHHKWGYHPKLHRKYRQLMTSGYFDPVPFASLRNQTDYERYVNKLHETTPGFVTPTQLFQPYYGWVIADYLVTTWRNKFDPREPLIVYDVGAGVGALAVSVLDYLAEHFPDVYEICEYHVIELNAHLIPVLRNRMIHHYHHVKIHHLSFLNWREKERRRCVVLAIELFSGLPHDCVLWDTEGICSEHWWEFKQHDNLATAVEKYYALEDPIMLRYLRYLNWMQEETFHALKVLCITDGKETIDAPRFHSIAPEAGDSISVIVSKTIWIHSPWRTAWLPTGQMLMLEVLAQYFPRHHLFAADWGSVKQCLPGVNAPVVQSKVRVAKDVYLRRPSDRLESNMGLVDICFPTNFEHLAVVYGNTCGREKEITSMSHPEFWRTYGGEKTALFTTKSGYNPLIEDFEPFHVFATHHPPEM